MIVKAIEMYEKLQNSRKVGEAMGVSKDQIQGIVKCIHLCFYYIVCILLFLFY